MIQIKNTFLLLMILLISACGYHLRGHIDLPDEFKYIYLSKASSRLTWAMEKILKSSGGKLVKHEKTAGLIVQIIKERMERRVLSLSSTGRANEYELTYSLVFNLLDKEKKLIAERQRLEVSRDYFNNQEQVLAKDNEEQVMRDEMYRNAVQSVIRHARMALKNAE